METKSMAHTGTPDPVYDLISVAYHALQGAETYEQYAQDAQRQGDQELADYFRKTQQECRRSADEAQRLLASRLQQGTMSATE
jgi:rubrerythrin